MPKMEKIGSREAKVSSLSRSRTTNLFPKTQKTTASQLWFFYLKTIESYFLAKAALAAFTIFSAFRPYFSSN